MAAWPGSCLSLPLLCCWLRSPVSLPGTSRFVIDDEELRIESGAIFKKSTKIPFERLQSVDIIQPLAARIVGLAELRLDAGNSSTKLRYLSRGKASRLRDYLLTRAHGQQASIRDLDQQAAASIFTDLGVADRPLVQVSPQRLILSFLLSTEWIIPAAITIIILVVTAALAATPYALGGLIPLLIGMLTLVWRRVIGMFNFTLAESPRGLRVTRGLTNLTSQSVPIDRIQGVKTVSRCSGSRWAGIGWTSISSATPTTTAITMNRTPRACCSQSPTLPKLSLRWDVRSRVSTLMPLSCTLL